MRAEPEIQPRQRSLWWSVFEWTAAAAAVVVVFLLIRENGELQRRVANLQSSSAGEQKQLQQAKELLATLTAPGAARYVLVAAKTPPQPQGRAIYVASSGTLVFLASNMPALPPQKVYELWLIPENGAPVPAGLFRPDSLGSAAVVKPALPAGLEAKTFAITVEPEAGSAAPTSAVLMLGTKG